MVVGAPLVVALPAGAPLVVALPAGPARSLQKIPVRQCTVPPGRHKTCPYNFYITMVKDIRLTNKRSIF